MVGGYLDSQWTPSNKLFIYDPLKNKWHEGKQMPPARPIAINSLMARVAQDIGN